MGRVGDFFQDGVKIVENLLIQESKNYVVMALEVGVTIPVVRLLLLSLMDFSVKLYDYPPIAAAEVRNERTYGMLTEKFQPVKPSVSEVLPKDLFRRGLIPPQLSRLLLGSHPHPSKDLVAYIIATMHAFLPLSR